MIIVTLFSGSNRKSLIVLIESVTINSCTKLCCCSVIKLLQSMKVSAKLPVMIRVDNLGIIFIELLQAI